MQRRSISRVYCNPTGLIICAEGRPPSYVGPYCHIGILTSTQGFLRTFATSRGVGYEEVGERDVSWLLLLLEKGNTTRKLLM